MKSAQFATSQLLLAVWLLWSVAVGGCATKPRIDWNSRIGAYNYDQAVTEMGPPDKSARLSDGTVVAEWITARGFTSGTIYTYGGLVYPYYAGPVWQHYVDAPAPNRYLRLTFDPDGKLSKWQRVVR
jgi:hypothetical protein